MFSYLPIRKVSKYLFKKGRPLKKQDRQPSSLSECLLKEPTEQERNEYRILLLISLILFIIIIVIYFYHMHYTTEETIDLSFNDTNAIQNSKLPLCQLNMSTGKITVHRLLPENAMNHIYPIVKKGGRYAPNECRPAYRVAILVPYRDREQHLRIFLYNMHPFLIRQKLSYRIFIIEQEGTEEFNRGRLFNAGFKEAMKLDKWQCIVFHDVDLLPLTDRIFYTCPIWPRNLCGKIVEEKRYRFRTFYGGVSVINVEHFYKVNGYSNYYWGWGGEDDDIFKRLQDAGIPVTKYDEKVALYTTLRHVKQQPNRYRYKLLKTATDRYTADGLSTLKYKVTSITMKHLYTHITVNINPDKENIQDVIRRII